MQMDDLVIISVDDHAVEPPEAFIRHYPEGKKDRAPRIVKDDGKDIWLWNGQRFPTIGLNAVVGRPRSEYGMEPSAFARPGMVRFGPGALYPDVPDPDVEHGRHARRAETHERSGRPCGQLLRQPVEHRPAKHPQ